MDPRATFAASTEPSTLADARKSGSMEVTVSWLRSLKKEAMPVPTTVELSQRAFAMCGLRDALLFHVQFLHGRFDRCLRSAKDHRQTGNRRMNQFDAQKRFRPASAKRRDAPLHALAILNQYLVSGFFDRGRKIGLDGESSVIFDSQVQHRALRDSPIKGRQGHVPYRSISVLSAA